MKRKAGLIDVTEDEIRDAEFRFKMFESPDDLINKLERENKDLNRHRKEYYYPWWGIEFDVRMMRVEIPDWVFEEISENDIAGIIQVAAEQERQDFEMWAKGRYKWIEEAAFVGRSGGWLAILFDYSAFKDYRINYEEAEALLDEAQKAIQGKGTFDRRDLDELQELMKDLKKSRNEIFSIINTVKPLREEVKKRLREFEDLLSSDEFWRENLGL